MSWGLWQELFGRAKLPERRIKRVEIGLRNIRAMFTTGYRPMHYEITEGIPRDAHIIGSQVDQSREVLVLYVEHASFPEITLDGEALDNLYVTAHLSTFEHCRWGEAVAEEAKT